MSTPDQNVLRDLLGKDVCHFAINHGNAVLVNETGDSEEASGITIDLAREIAASLGAKLQLHHFKRAVEVSESAGHGVWDICFLAIDPKRAERIAFSEPYIQISGNYLVGIASAEHTPDEIDREGIDVVCVRGSAYSLYLRRNAAAANIIEVETFEEALEHIESAKVDAMAGVREALSPYANPERGLRLIEKPFMTINQAVGCALEKQALASHLARFVQQAKADGTIAKILRRHGVA